MARLREQCPLPQYQTFRIQDNTNGIYTPILLLVATAAAVDTATEFL
jgi:hypothetical protein